MRVFIFSLLFAITIVSCVPHKKYLYFREGSESAVIKTFSIDTTFKYAIQPGDILNITISSTVVSKQELLYQKFQGDKGGPENSTNMNGYVVANDGNIELPLVGKIMVAGLSIEQINEVVKTHISEYLDHVFIKVSLLNFKITVLGEVKTPGTKMVNDEKITVFQALGLAGDITDAGNRRNVRVIRKINNETQVVSVDVSKATIIGSKYYYLYPNDVLYVEPLKAKAIRYNLTLISVAMSIITFVIIILPRISQS